MDGKKRTVRGVARRAAKPSKEAGKGGHALYDGLRERYDLQRLDIRAAFEVACSELVEAELIASRPDSAAH